MVVAPIYTPTQTGTKGSLFFISLPTLVICFFDDSHFKRCEKVSHCDSDPLMISDAEHLIMCLSALYIFLGKMSVPLHIFKLGESESRSVMPDSL